MSSIQSSLTTPLDTTTQSSSYYPAYHPVPSSSSSDSSYYQSPHSPATNYYSNYSSTFYSPAYASNSYNHYSQSTPMWQSSVPASAYQQFQSKSLNESYVGGQDSAYYSQYSSNSVAFESSCLKEESKKRAAVDETSAVNDENDEKVSRKRPRIEKFAYYISAENESTCKLCAAEFESVSKCLMHVHIIHKQRDANECPICCEYSFN